MEDARGRPYRVPWTPATAEVEGGVEDHGGTLRRQGMAAGMRTKPGKERERENARDRQKNVAGDGWGVGGRDKGDASRRRPAVTGGGIQMPGGPPQPRPAGSRNAAEKKRRQRERATGPATGGWRFSATRAGRPDAHDLDACGRRRAAAGTTASGLPSELRHPPPLGQWPVSGGCLCHPRARPTPCGREVGERCHTRYWIDISTGSVAVGGQWDAVAGGRPLGNRAANWVAMWNSMHCVSSHIDVR